MSDLKYRCVVLRLPQMPDLLNIPQNEVLKHLQGHWVLFVHLEDRSQDARLVAYHNRTTLRLGYNSVDLVRVQERYWVGVPCGLNRDQELLWAVVD